MTAPIEIVKQCVWCGQPSSVTISSDEDWNGYWAWKEKGEFIQSAFRHWSPGKREVLISGTHEKCFDEMFKEEDCDGEHDWPPELTSDAECYRCGLAFGQWSKEGTHA